MNLSFWAEFFTKTKNENEELYSFRIKRKRYEICFEIYFLVEANHLDIGGVSKLAKTTNCQKNMPNFNEKDMTKAKGTFIKYVQGRGVVRDKKQRNS